MVIDEAKLFKLSKGRVVKFPSMHEYGKSQYGHVYGLCDDAHTMPSVYVKYGDTTYEVALDDIELGDE
jgi:hypothetical protein